MNTRGFSLIELMISVSIMTIAGAATIRFFSDSQRATRSIESRLEAASESVRVSDLIRASYRSDQSSVVLSMDADGRAQSFVAGGSTYENACETALPQFAKRAAPLLAGGPADAQFADCPAACAAGKRPVIRITNPAGGTRVFPSRSQNKLFGAVLCANQLGMKRYSYAFNDTPTTNPPHRYYNIYVFVAYDAASGKDAKDQFVWSGQGAFLAPSLSGLVTTK